ncbi:hypothetical protein [Henriciella sp.]|uniref:hypothetical protein n=1 Tax=Henriciella sp. TaxID=1968823 RepID=UPI0026343BE2|nr:hypothetical protein [Henriciella sp.]
MSSETENRVDLERLDRCLHDIQLGSKREAEAGNEYILKSFDAVLHELTAAREQQALIAELVEALEPFVDMRFPESIPDDTLFDLHHETWQSGGKCVCVSDLRKARATYNKAKGEQDA